MAGTALAVALIAPAGIASAQAPPRPAVFTRADDNAAIVKPLTEIGRVRSRTPYCGALARARAGIDSAIAFEFTTPAVATDLRNFRLDSYLNREKSRNTTERDLTVLWNLAVTGRKDVLALRVAANADGVDEQKRKAMLDFANALDGAKGRQMMLAKSLARVYGVVAESPVRDITNTPDDDHGAAAVKQHTAGTDPGATDPTAASLKTYTTTAAEYMEDHEHLQQLFSAFSIESFIRDDLKRAAAHGNKAVQLGSCNNV